jgi:hypothetical protein
MSTRQVQLVDQSRDVLATAQVADEGGYFGGTIDLHSTPAHLRALFEEFEEIVNNQMFVFLDEIQEKIGSLPVKAVFDDGFEVDVKDLQVFPSTGDVSFRLAGVPLHTAKPA